MHICYVYVEPARAFVITLQWWSSSQVSNSYPDLLIQDLLINDIHTFWWAEFKLAGINSWVQFDVAKLNRRRLA